MEKETSITNVPHVRAFLRETTIQKLEKILGKRIRSKIDLHINEALNRIPEKYWEGVEQLNSTPNVTLKPSKKVKT